MFWLPVLVASVAAYLTKLTGYLIPAEWLERPRIKQIAEVLPIGMLAALITTQTVGNGQQLQLDGRIIGVAVAVIVLRLRANFIVVVLSAAIVTATGRALGWLA